MSARDDFYNRSPKGKARAIRFRKSAKGRAMIARYTRSKAHKECRRRYMSKPEVREHYNWLARQRTLRDRIQSMSI